MPVAIVAENAIAGAELPRRRFTRREVESLLKTGFFGGQRFELIDGDIIDKMGQNPPHARAVQRCMAVLVKVFGFARVRVQAPITVGRLDSEWTEPEPDLAVLMESTPDCEERHPTGEESALLVEVADTTLRPDLTTKRNLYARAGVPEYWVLDLNGRRLIVHRGLDANTGDYIDVTSYSEGEAVEIEGRGVEVSAMLG